MRQPWHQPQPDARDDGEGSLGPGNQAAKVVPGVVLRHAGQPAQHAAIGQNRLEAEDLAAHWPMTQNVDAAGVGRHHPADRRRVPSAQVDPHVPAHGARGGLDGREGRAGPDGHLASFAIRLAELIEAEQTEDDLASARDRAADQAGVAALRHHSDAGLRTGTQHGRDLTGRSRTRHGEGGARESTRPIGLVRGAQRRIGQTVAFADGIAQSGEQFGGHG